MHKILGSDGNQYDPVSAEQVKKWIVENRVEKNTPILLEGAPALVPGIAFSTPETRGGRQRPRVDWDCFGRFVRFWIFGVDGAGSYRRDCPQTFDAVTFAACIKSSGQTAKFTGR